MNIMHQTELTKVFVECMTGRELDPQQMQLLLMVFMPWGDAEQQQAAKDEQSRKEIGYIVRRMSGENLQRLLTYAVKIDNMTQNKINKKAVGC